MWTQVDNDHVHFCLLYDSTQDITGLSGRAPHTHTLLSPHTKHLHNTHERHCLNKKHNSPFVGGDIIPPWLIIYPEVIKEFALQSTRQATVGSSPW